MKESFIALKFLNFFLLSFFQVTAMKCGLLPISQDAMIIGPVSYHDFQGIVNDENERDSIIKDLGPVNKVRKTLTDSFLYSISYFN